MNTRFLMTLRVTVANPQIVGAVPLGTRRTAPLSGGDFEGPRLRGTVVAAASADWLLLRADGVLELDLRATLRTNDGALLLPHHAALRYRGREICVPEPDRHGCWRRPPRRRSDLHHPRSPVTRKEDHGIASTYAPAPRDISH